MDWFLYDRDLFHERVKEEGLLNSTPPQIFLLIAVITPGWLVLTVLLLKSFSDQRPSEISFKIAFSSKLNGCSATE